jgi:hypothetical protein
MFPVLDIIGVVIIFSSRSPVYLDLAKKFTIQLNMELDIRLFSPRIVDVRK